MELVPIITSPYNIIYKISQYLDQLLRPFAHAQMSSVVFKDDIDFIQKLHVYVHSQHRLTTTTMFCTIDVVNYWALDTHENMINIVCKFIRDYALTNKLQKVSIATIKNLLQLCLHHNKFYYKDTIYAFTKGGPTTLPLIDTLSSIYLSAWQDNIVYEIQLNKELLGRSVILQRFFRYISLLFWHSSYKNRLFFTWNGFKNELEYFLQTIQQRYPQIRIQTSIDTSATFFNAYVANQNGQLFTRLHHNPTIQPYTLPYVTGHSKVKHSDWIRMALVRAVCYCSSVDDFQQQRIYLELSCLANGYSIRFVDSRVAHFFEYFHADHLRYSMEQSAYEKFRRQYFDFKDMNRALSEKLQNLADNGQVIRFNYLYEYGARCQFNEGFQQLWLKNFDNHPTLSANKCTVLLTTKHVHSLNTLLSQQKSSSRTTI